MASLHAEKINWKDRTIHYRRRKSGSDAMPRFGNEAAAVLARRPKSGPLFPYLITVREKDRATELKQRCDGLGIKGITLHCYRYTWAERAVKAGYPERHAQSNLGHGSKALARAYAKRAKVKTPSLEDYEKAQQNGGGNLVPFPGDVEDGERYRLAIARQGTDWSRVQIERHWNGQLNSNDRRRRRSRRFAQRDGRKAPRGRGEKR